MEAIYSPYPTDGSLVCDRKKYVECYYVNKFLALLSLRPTSFVCDESPDFRIGLDGKRAGIEVTYFHSSAKGADGRPRRAVEEDWDCLQGEIMSVIGKVPKLKGVFGLLEFRALELPARRQHKQFVQGLLKLALRTMTTASLKVELGEEDSGLLSRYLKKLTLERVGCYCTWDWNHSGGFVGLSEEELMAAVAPKAARSADYLMKDEFDELWLLVVSEHRLSQTIPPMLLDRLNSFETLNTELQTSGFVRVFLYQYLLDVIYEWPGWKKHGKENFISTVDKPRKRSSRDSG